MYACFDQPTIFSMLDEPQFIHDSTASTASTSASSTSTASPSSSTSSSAAPSSGGSSGSNAGAIAGGVVGGVAVLALALGAALYFVRRSKNRGGGPRTYNKLSSGDASSQGMLPLQSPQPSYRGGAASPYSLDGSFYDARQSYLYDPTKQDPGPLGIRQYYDQNQRYDPPQPPSELAAEAHPQGYAEMASDTPSGQSGAQSKPYEMEGKM